MKKRWMSLLLTGVMALGALAGPEITFAAETTEESAGSEVWDGEVSHVVMTYMTTGVTPSGIDAVEAAVNEITVPNIGVELEMKPISIADAGSQYSLWITAGDQIDLMMVMFMNLSNYSSQGLIMPLDDLLKENAPYITACLEEENLPLCDGTYYQGETYGVTPVNYQYGMNGAFIFIKSYLDGAGIEYDENKVYTLDEMTDIFAKLKETYPDMYPCGIISAGQSSSTVSYWDMEVDTLGNSYSSGVLIGTDSTTIENLFASEGYYNQLKHFKEWYDAGYIFPDAATTNSNQTELLKAGTIAGIPRMGYPVMKTDMTVAVGQEMVSLPFSEPYYNSASQQGCFWTVPITSADPDAAIRFLDYVYSNHDVENLLMWGIEGENYEVLDADKRLIGFPDGVDGTNSTYYNGLGLYGDRRYEYVWDEANSMEVNEAYTERAMDNQTKAIGYAYDTSAMQTKLANIDAVMAQYIPTLESGSAKDLDGLYQEFLDKLEDAGISEVISDNQKQFDEWLSKQK